MNVCLFGTELSRDCMSVFLFFVWLFDAPARSSLLPSVCGSAGVFEEQADRDGSYGDGEELSDAEVNGAWTPQEKALHEARLKAKARRRLRRTSSRESGRDSASEASGDPAADLTSPKSKPHTNDRKSRMGKGRGLPKKGMYAPFP